MKWINLIALCLATSASAEPLQIMSGFVGRDDLSVHFKTKLEPGSDETRIGGLGGGMQTSQDRFHRIIFDRAAKRYFGYDIVAERGAGKLVTVSLLPLSRTKSQLHLDDADEWTAHPLPAYAGTQTLQLGDTIAVDVMTNPVTGQKLVDYLTIDIDMRRHISASGSAKDFSVSDAWLQLNKPRVTIDGELFAPERPSSRGANPDPDAWAGSVSGSLAWLYVPGYGRYILSLIARSEHGFRQAGEIRGSTLTFEWAGTQFELNCSGRIAHGGTAYNLYVLHQPAYVPSGEPEPGLRLGAAGQVRSLLQ